jgi:hypothetical protein
MTLDTKTPQIYRKALKFWTVNLGQQLVKSKRFTAVN